MRRLLFGAVPLQYHGLTSWAFWLDPAFEACQEVVEYWAVGRFVGIYPAKDALCCFIAAMAPAGQADPATERIGRIRASVQDLGGIVPRVLTALPPPEEIWHDAFYDLRLRRWRRGRVVLIGDAGAAILPSAGVGASMAMESAAVLADELSRADSRLVEHSLDRFIARRRTRVDRVQRQSRTLARYALVARPLAARARDILVRCYSQRHMERTFAHLVATTI